MEQAVRERYSRAALQKEESLCCPVKYDSKYLEVIPQEVLERDYGCGDPSRYLKEGEIVLDFGSGTGKICFIASQVVGPKGRVIGVDINDEMLTVARSANSKVSKRLGYSNIQFKKGKIQDLKTDVESIDRWLRQNPITCESELARLESYVSKQRDESPLIAGESVDVVVSSCVLNLVNNNEKPQLFREIFRVIRYGGRAVISDIVSDEVISSDLKKDPELWSGCISGALHEFDFLKAFEDAGFYGIEIVKRDEKPWRIVHGIEFRSITVAAYKGKDGACWDYKEGVIYKGPFREVIDDDGHRYLRGQRVAVCRKTFNILSKPPHDKFFEYIKPLKEVSEGEAKPFPCTKEMIVRSPKETKGEGYDVTYGSASNCCEPGTCK